MSTILAGDRHSHIRAGRLGQVLPWFSKGAAAFADQLLTSGSNFLVTILLARWLTAAQYGAYALAFSVFLLLSSVHGSLLIDPMPVFGPSVYGHCRRAYLGLLLWIHFAFSLLFVFVLACSTLVADHLRYGAGFKGALAGLILATPCVLLFWLARQAFYVEQTPGPAAAAAGVYSVVVCGGIWVAYRLRILNPFAAFLVIAIAALVTSLLMLLSLKPVLSLRPADVSLRRVWRDHWSYGRWAWGTSAMRWIPANVSYVLTGGILGMADVGALKALLNLLLPFSHSAVSVSRVFQPYVSAAFGREGRLSTKRPVERVTLVFLAGGLIYGLLLTIFRKPVFFLLYGGKFAGFVHLIPWIAVGAILMGTSYGPSAGLKAMQSPASVFLAYTVAAGVSIAATFLAVWAFGLPGAIAAFVLSSATVLVISSVLFRRRITEDQRRPPTYSLTGTATSL